MTARDELERLAGERDGTKFPSSDTAAIEGLTGEGKSGAQSEVNGLRASEERLRLALEATRDGLFDWDLTTDRVFYSTGWKAMLGYGEEEVEPSLSAWARLVHPDDREPTLRVVDDFRQGRRADFQVEFRMRHKAGHWVTILSRGALLSDQNGTPVRLIGTHVDISARRRDEEALRAREAELRTLVESSGDFILRLDRTGRQVYVNPAMARALGRQPEELLGRRLRDLGMPPTVWKPAREAFERILNSGRGETFEVAHTLGGALRHFEAACVPELRADGSVNTVLVIAREVTARKYAEEALRDAELRARALAEAAFEGIVIHDAGMIIEVNEVAANLFGRPPGELVGTSLLDLLDAGEGGILEDALQGGDRGGCEAMGLRPDGTSVPLELQSRAFPYLGRAVRVTAVRDLTPSRAAQARIKALQAEEALKREKAQRESFARQLIIAQEKERERIASELHDGLGQNVLVMKHQAERGLAEPPSTERMRESLSSIVSLAGQSVHDIRHIVRHLRPHLLRQLGLTRALRAMVDTLGQSSAIRFTSDVQAVDHLLPRESEIAWYRVLQECLNNVVRHSGATSARLEVRCEPGRLAAAVRDDGRGFDANRLLAGGDAAGGLGLRSIVERMALLGGTSRFVTRPGGGTLVELSLPLPPTPAV